MYKLIKHNIEKEELIEPMVESLLIKLCHAILKCGHVLTTNQLERKMIGNKDCPENN